MATTWIPETALFLHCTQLPSPLERSQAASMCWPPTYARALFPPAPPLHRELILQDRKAASGDCNLHRDYDECTSHQPGELCPLMQKCFVSWASPKERKKLSELTQSKCLWGSTLSMLKSTSTLQIQCDGKYLGSVPARLMRGQVKLNLPQINVYHYFLLYAMLLEKNF